VTVKRITVARALSLIVALPACQGGEKNSGAAASASGAAPLPALSAVAPVNTKTDSWYAGTWTGTYEAAKHHIDLPAKIGGLPEWAADEGARGTGKGSVRLTPDSTGAATGSVEGPLGPAVLEGAFDGDVLALRFYPKNAERSGFSGVLIARRDGERLTGSLDAATTDGRVARTAQITLERAAP
jgi:hypothetical protein